jgi:hypothetical protein
MSSSGCKTYAFSFAILLIALAIYAAPCRASLSMSADTSIIHFGIFRVPDLNLGFKELTPSDLTYALRLTIMDDVPAGWMLQTKAETEYFSSTGGIKPCSDARWRLNGSNIYTPYSTNDVTVASGDGDAFIDMDFEMLANWMDTPGDYSINVVFTLFEN